MSWNAATTRTTDLVLTCLQMGRWDRTRQGLVLQDGLIHHHDAGSQYTALRFTGHLALEGMTPSIGSVGDAYDNCLMELIIGLYKTECIRPGPFVKGPLKTLSDVEYVTMAWVDWDNNAGCTQPRKCPTCRVRGRPLRSDHCAPAGDAARMKTAEKP